MNPIIQMLGGCQQNNVLNQISNLSKMVNGNPHGFYNQMMQSNPKFAQFVKDNQGKSPEQIARENGIDPGILNQILGGR